VALRVPPVLESGDAVVGIAHNARIAGRTASLPLRLGRARQQQKIVFIH
jgi:hypothetical protein